MEESNMLKLFFVSKYFLGEAFLSTDCICNSILSRAFSMVGSVSFLKISFEAMMCVPLIATFNDVSLFRVSEKGLYNLRINRITPGVQIARFLTCVWPFCGRQAL